MKKRRPAPLIFAADLIAVLKSYRKDFDADNLFEMGARSAIDEALTAIACLRAGETYDPATNLWHPPVEVSE